MAVYKSFIRRHLYYGDIIYDQPFSNSFQNKIESIQYNACLVIAGAIRGTSKEGLYKELGLESLQHRRWYRKLGYLYKSPNYLFKVVPSSNTIYNTSNTNNIPLMNIKHNFFKNTFFPSTIIDCSKLDPATRSSTSFNSFKESILKDIVKWDEPCKCVILLVSRILWHKRINPSLKEWRFWYLILTGHFPP